MGLPGRRAGACRGAAPPGCVRLLCGASGPRSALSPAPFLRRSRKRPGRRAAKVVLLLIRGCRSGAGALSAPLVPACSLGSVTAWARARGVREVVMVGALTRPRLRDLGFDFTMLRLLPRIARLFRGGDDHLLSGVLSAVLGGATLVGAHRGGPAPAAAAGRAGRAPSETQQADIARGLDVIRALGPFDVGQGAVVDGLVAAVQSGRGDRPVPGALRRDAFRPSALRRRQGRAGEGADGAGHAGWICPPSAQTVTRGGGGPCRHRLRGGRGHRAGCAGAGGGRRRGRPVRRRHRRAHRVTPQNVTRSPRSSSSRVRVRGPTGRRADGSAG